jgi:protein-disulfide isomerase
MTSTRGSRQAKIQAAAPRGGGAHRLVVATAVLVVLIAGVVAAVIVGSLHHENGVTSGGSSLPAGAAAMGAGIVINPDAPTSAPRLDLYVDYQCPACGRFERSSGAQLTALADAGRVRLVIHPLSFLDDRLGNDSSNRAANAAACAADQGRFLPYHNAVFAGQPAQEGQGYTDRQLTAFATTAGLRDSALDAWQRCYDGREHNRYVASVQTRSEKDGINQTPTLELNGRRLEPGAVAGPQALTEAIEAASR